MRTKSQEFSRQMRGKAGSGLQEPFGSIGSRSRHGSPASSSRPFSAGRGQRPRSGRGLEPRPGRMGYNVWMAPPGVPLTRLDNLIMYGEMDPQWRVSSHCVTCLGLQPLDPLPHAVLMIFDNDII